MLIISDTTPIISLIKIGKLDILNSMYGDIIIPVAVYNELVSNPLMKNEVETVKKSKFLKVTKVENLFAVKLLQKQLNLGAGESEAIVLSDSLKADLLVIDEKKARGVAENMGIAITGTLGILVDAKRQNRLKELKPLLDNMIINNIRISDKLYNDVLELVNENPIQ